MKGKTISRVMLLLLFVGVFTLPWQIECEVYDNLIPVSSGISVTVYERTGGTYIQSFSVPVLMEAGGTFSTSAFEYYNVTSDGTYLKIHCFTNGWHSGHAVGNNIVAVKLNGVPSFPEGLWASIIVNYTLGYNGIAESRFNALGPDTQIGPYIYGRSLCTYMGDQHSELVLGFARPHITILSPQNKSYATTSVPLTFTVNETTSWMGYSLDGQANVTITGNTTLAGLLEGSHNVVVYANNTAGKMWASRIVYFTVDLTLPTVSVLSPENTTYSASSVPLSYTVSESTSWKGYSLDGQANVTSSGDTVLTGLTEGSHSVVVYAEDMAGNIGASDKVFFTVELPVGGLSAISVEPSQTVVAVHQSVTITIIVTNITDCAGFQFLIDYNSTILEMISWTFDTGTPLTPSQLAPAPSDRVDTDVSVPGSVRVATVWKAGVPAYSGSGVAAKVTLRALTRGNSTLVFYQSSTKAVNSIGEEILFDRFDDGWVLIEIPGDVDGDRDVDVIDQRLLQLAMFSMPGDANWNPNADIDGNSRIDVIDQRIQCLYMFESW